MRDAEKEEEREKEGRSDRETGEFVLPEEISRRTSARFREIVLLRRRITAGTRRNAVFGKLLLRTKNIDIAFLTDDNVSAFLCDSRSYRYTFAHAT